MAIFRGLLHNSLRALPMAVLLARWLGTVFRFMGRRERNSLAPALLARASHPRALPALSPTLASAAAMRPSPNYVLAALYLLGDANAERTEDVRGRECLRSSVQQEGRIVVRVEKLILRQQLRASYLFREVVLCGKPES